MAAGTFESTDTLVPGAAVHAKKRAREENVLTLAIEALSSLKLTVALFAYGIFVVLVGTLAQTEMDIWQVVPLYFRSWVMWLDVNLFFPESFFPDMPHLKVGAIPLPGGMLVGVLMLANLTAAHLWRFQMQAKGKRLWTGLGVLAAGIAITTAIIVSGNLGTGVQAKPFLSPGQIWGVFLGVVLTGWVTASYFFGRYALQEWSAMFRDKALFWFRLRLLFLFASGYVALTGLVGSMFSGILEPPTESMRILWQLLQGTAAGAVLLAGCWMLFQKRAGIVLLHAGVVLMMVNELVVARYAIEWQMTLEEGEAANFARDIRTTELAIIDRSGDGDKVTVIPGQLLETNAAENQKLADNAKPAVAIADEEGEDSLLPFGVTVLKHFRNHNPRALKPGEKTLATAGIGTTVVAEEARSAKGTDSGGEVDIGAIYARLTEKKSGRDLGTYLISQLGEEGVGVNPQKFRETVEVGGKKYLLVLRFARDYKPYTVKLIDVRKDDYLGSDTPKNYSSDVQLVDPETNIDNKIHIKMNDPLRYRGDTFYQSSYARQPNGSEVTTLAVVSNVGWMIPYLACMIVATGMIFQFGLALDRFLNRRSQEEALARAPIKPGMSPAGIRGAMRHAAADGPPIPLTSVPLWDGSRATIIAVALSALFAIGYIASKVRQPKAAANQMNLVEVGKLPVVQTGRVKPLDTLARNSLRALSNYEEVKYGKDGKEIELPAIAWLLDSVTGQAKAFHYRVIKIDSPDLHKLFDLQRQPRHLYSLSQVADHGGEIRKMAMAAHKKQKENPSSVTQLDRNALALDEKLRLYNALMVSFNPPILPPLPSEKEVNEDPANAKRMVDEFRLKLMEVPQEMSALGVPLIVPTEGDEGDANRWLPYPTAWVAAYVQSQILGEKPNATTFALQELLTAYRDNDPAEFNKKLTAYRAEMARVAPDDYNPDKVRREAYFNHVSPFYVGAVLYVMALVLALFGWLTQLKPLHLAAVTMIGITFLFHSIALGERIYISGRPPVTNLYSSAVFIGWGCVLFCLVLEGIYRNGLGNVVGAVTGFAALVISYLLAAGGDTIAVLQAVLDTQFWLATHVVLISLGYTATFVAGFFGLCYLLSGICTPNLSDKLRSELARMIYGVTCFAIILSFVGTVLGGLWADDSWGRFWGWDPKENGALMIVMWNALVLHARWDKLVKDRGLALLAIGGNIVTAWSWFGVNELGIGLHSYGFTDGVLRALGTFCIYMICCVAFGIVPLRMWWSAAQGKGSWGSLVAAVMGMLLAAGMVALAVYVGREDVFLKSLWLVATVALVGMSTAAVAGFIMSRLPAGDKPQSLIPVSLSLAVSFALLHLSFLTAMGYYVLDYYDVLV